MRWIDADKLCNYIQSKYNIRNISDKNVVFAMTDLLCEINEMAVSETTSSSDAEYILSCLKKGELPPLNLKSKN